MTLFLRSRATCPPILFAFCLCPGLDLMVTLFCQCLFFKLVIISYLYVQDGVHGCEREHFSRRY
jgi:hypothetical protein